MGIRIPKSVLRQLDYLVKAEGFQNRSDLIRWLIRQEYELFRLSKAIGEDLSVRAWAELVRRKKLIQEGSADAGLQ